MRAEPLPLRPWLSALPVGTSALGHVPWSRATADLVAAQAVRMVTIVRDPRDVVVSYALHVAENARGTYGDRYRSLSEPEQLLRWINGKVGPEGRTRRRSIREGRGISLEIGRWRSKEVAAAETSQRH